MVEEGVSGCPFPSLSDLPLGRRTEKGRAYGIVTAKALAVLEALLWAFHNARSGLCFPSYETIADAAHCARSTVAEALKALEEDAGVLSWVQRIKRVRERCSDRGGDLAWKNRTLAGNSKHGDGSDVTSFGNPSDEVVSNPMKHNERDATLNAFRRDFKSHDGSSFSDATVGARARRYAPAQRDQPP